MKIKFRSEKQQVSDVEGGVRLSYASARRAGYRLRRYILLALVLSPMFILAWYLLSDKIFISAPGVITTEPMEIRSSGSGFVEQLLVEAGDYVTAGQSLAKVTSPVLNTRATTLAFQREQLNFQLRDFDIAILKSLEQALYEAREGMQQQSGILNQFREANKKGIVPTTDMAAIMNTYATRRLAVHSATSELERERRKQQLEHISSSLIQQQQALDLDLAETKTLVTILQPQANSSAVVAEVLVREGDWIKELTPLFLLTQRQKPFVRAFLEARYAPQCIDGAEVTILFPSGDEVLGRIRGQTVLARRLPVGLAKPFEADKPALQVTIEIEGNTDIILIEGLPVEVRF
ncbi:MAG: biotin/lipoyl-binding protein [Methylococcaceae bacterium]|nr:biotin/lipoyl-binding protein [Methylococcaceae bacterium]